VEDTAVQPLASVSVTVYVPPLAAVSDDKEGFLAMELKPAGPAQLYEYIPKPPEGVETRLSKPEVQTGELLPVATAGAVLLETARLVDAVDVQPFASVTVRL